MIELSFFTYYILIQFNHFLLKILLVERISTDIFDKLKLHFTKCFLKNINIYNFLYKNYCTKMYKIVLRLENIFYTKLIKFKTNIKLTLRFN